MSESNLPSAVTRLWTEPGLRKRADVMFNLLADVEKDNVSNLVSQLATLNEFWLIMRLLDAVDYGAPATADGCPAATPQRAKPESALYI